MKRKVTAFLSLALALLLALSPVSAGAVYKTGDEVISFVVRDTESHVLGDGLMYNQYTFDDEDGREQICFTMEFNPKESDFRTYIYHTTASAGYTIVKDAENAQKEGLDVYAAVNGDFFSMDAADYGTPCGIYIRDGKLTVSTVGLSNYHLAVAEDGTASVVQSCLSYDLQINGEPCTALTTVNKKINTGGFKAEYVYYFDGDIGAESPVSPSAPCKELLCDITGGKLAVGQTLEGKVAEVRTGGGSAIGKNQFVLAVGNSVSAASAVAVGDPVSLAVDETFEESKETMRNAAHAILIYYLLVHNGVDRIESGEVGNSTQLAQRCAYGIKPDGTIVYLTCDGRRSTAGGNNGMTFRQLSDVMQSYGCSEVINFDGGGSTAAVIGEGDGRFGYEFIGAGNGSDGRPVANSILIVRDPKAAPLPPTTYTPIVDKEGTELRNVALNKPYTVTQNGIMQPTVVSSAMGDMYNVKMTDGRYRVSGEDPDRYSTVFLGRNFNMSYVFDFEKDRDDLRSVVLRDVVQDGKDYDFKDENIITYFSDDGMTWAKSADFDIAKTAGGAASCFDYTCTFREAQRGRYMKLVFGSPSNRVRLDEIEVYGMVDVSEPKEEIKPEDPALSNFADEPTDANENVALGAGYELLCRGKEIAPYNTDDVPRYHNNASFADKAPGRLTDGVLGTSGTYHDGATVAFISGTGKSVQVTIDLGKVVDDIEFVQIQNMINNGSSFGHADTATVTFSKDGTTDENFAREHADTKESLSPTPGTQYYSLTEQFVHPVSARYIRVFLYAPKYLFGFGEVTVRTAAPEAPRLLGDVNGDGEIDNLDAAFVLQYDAGLIEAAELDVEAGDVNADEEVDNLDAVRILQYDAGVIESFD